MRSGPENVGSAESTRVSFGSALAVAAMVVATLQIGLLPAPLMAAAKRAMTSL
jgi:hypothetical protein